MKKQQAERNDVEWFMALPDNDKERIFQEIERPSPRAARRAESQPLSAEERRRAARQVQEGPRLGRGRPKAGEGLP